MKISPKARGEPDPGGREAIRIETPATNNRKSEGKRDLKFLCLPVGPEQPLAPGSRVG